MKTNKKRLQTVLAHAGVASRRKAAELIESGKVKVNGQLVKERGFRVDPEACDIQVSGQALPKEEKKYYFLFNKPKDVISTVTDTHDRKKVTDYFKDVKGRLYPVGRLDKDTTGVLIITNDGKLAHALSHPSFEIEKEYIATVEPYVNRDDIQRLMRGVKVEGKRTAPCKIELVKRNSKGAAYKIKLHEGRKRQIKKMFEAVGAKVANLRRSRYAGLIVGRLKHSEFRELTEREVAKLKGAK